MYSKVLKFFCQTLKSQYTLSEGICWVACLCVCVCVCVLFFIGVKPEIWASQRLRHTIQFNKTPVNILKNKINLRNLTGIILSYLQ